LACLLKDQVARSDALVIERNKFAYFYKNMMLRWKFEFQKIKNGNVSNYSQFSVLANTKDQADKIIKYFDVNKIEVIRPITYYENIFLKKDKVELKVFTKTIDLLICFPMNKELRLKKTMVYFKEIFNKFIA
jgi:hypothetical protein